MIVYVWGNKTADNFTPRPGKDTVCRAGQKPGLSASKVCRRGYKAQRIDLDLLASPLKPFFDQPAQGGTEGHVAIAPADPAGEVDMKALEEWAAFRNTGRLHQFTQILLDAVVTPDVRS